MWLLEGARRARGPPEAFLGLNLLGLEPWEALNAAGALAFRVGALWVDSGEARTRAA